MQIALDINFRPVQMEEYDDFVEVLVVNSGKTFRIPTVAKLARLAVRLQQKSLEFGLIPVKEVSKGIVRLENTGTADGRGGGGHRNFR